MARTVYSKFSEKKFEFISERKSKENTRKSRFSKQRLSKQRLSVSPSFCKLIKSAQRSVSTPKSLLCISQEPTCDSSAVNLCVRGVGWFNSKKTNKLPKFMLLKNK